MGSIHTHNGYHLYIINVEDYFKEKDHYDSLDKYYLLNDVEKKYYVIHNGYVIGHYDVVANWMKIYTEDDDYITLKDVFPDQMRIYEMYNDQDTVDALKTLERVRKKDLYKIFYTVAKLHYKNNCKSVILRVNCYERDNLRFEIMPIQQLAAHCPWDMREVTVEIDTEHTHINDNLHSLVVENAELSRYLKEIEDDVEFYYRTE